LQKTPFVQELYFQHLSIKYGRMFMQTMLKPKQNILIYLIVLATGLVVCGILFLPTITKAVHQPVLLFPYPYKTVSSDDALRKLEQDIAFYQQRSNLSPDDGLELASLASSYLTKARVSGWANWYLLSEQAAKRSLANLPVFNNGAILVLAEIAEARHDFKEAIRLASQVLDYQPGNESASSILVTANLAQGHIAEAQAVVDELVERVPTAGILSLRAFVYAAKGQDDLAQQDFEAAIGLEQPGDAYGSAWLRTQLGKLHARHGRVSEAETLYNEALRIASDYALAQLSLADLNVKTGDYKTAIHLYQDVLDRAKDSSTVFDHVALQGLWRAKTLQADRAGAVDVLAKAEIVLRQDAYSNAFGHPRELARLLLERGNEKDLPEAFSLLQTELSNRRDPVTLELTAWVFMKLNQYEDARTMIQEAMAHGFQDAGLYYRAGVIEEQLGEAEKAETYFNQALTIDPTFNAETWRKLEL
jgi:tetratricopeptide (TPR) repeat protein